MFIVQCALDFQWALYSCIFNTGTLTKVHTSLKNSMIEDTQYYKLYQSPAFVYITFKQLSVKVPLLYATAQNDIQTTTSSSIDHPVQYTVNFFLLKKQISHWDYFLFYGNNVLSIENTRKKNGELYVMEDEEHFFHCQKRIIKKDIVNPDWKFIHKIYGK